ncbi:glycoside hydrolase superfamily [Aspergillus varians]
MLIPKLSWLLAVASLAPISSAIPTQNGTQGIDLFEIHPPVNWKTAVANGVQFVFVKATEGINYTSPRFPHQTSSALNASILHGAIHFALASESSGADQANFFIEHGGNWTADGHTLPGVLEMEGNIAGKLCHGMTPTQITDWMLDFSTTYKRWTGRAPILFLSRKWWAQCAGGDTTFGAGHPLWLADWADRMGPLPVGWRRATFWQYAWSGNGGEADLFLGSRRDLERFARGG